MNEVETVTLTTDKIFVPSVWGVPNNSIAIQTAGIELSYWIGEVAGGSVEVTGYNYTYKELNDGGILVLATHKENRSGFYYDIRNANPIQVTDPVSGSRSYKFLNRLGIVGEIGFFAGDEVTDLNGVTLGANVHLAFAGAGSEDPISPGDGSGVTISFGPGLSLPGPVVTVGKVVSAATKIEEESIASPYLQLPDGRVFRVPNLYEQSTFELALEAYFAVFPNENIAPTAIAYQTDEGIAFLLSDVGGEGAQIYLPFSGELITLAGENVADQEAALTQVFEARNLSAFEVDPSFFSAKCFLAGTLIDMADGSQKPIELIEPDDLVFAYDERDLNGRAELVPARVVRTFVNQVPAVLDFHGLKVTPGHVTLCGDGRFEGRHRPLMDILSDDGAIVDRDGRLIRASTNLPVGSDGDHVVELACYAGPEARDFGHARMRLGTLFLRDDGETVRLSDLLETEGYQVNSDGLVSREGEQPQRLAWVGAIPKPEDYVLKKSGLTHADLYAAAVGIQAGNSIN